MSLSAAGRVDPEGPEGPEDAGAKLATDDVSRLVDRFRSQRVCYPELCAITSLAVGFACSIYWFGWDGPGKRGTRYQVMRWDEGPGPGLTFWRWYLWEKPQFHPTPAMAALRFIAWHRAWLRDPQEPTL
jgi:hypothetical protein